MSNIANITNSTANITNSTANITNSTANITTRKCSYCREPGHTISSCSLAYREGKNIHIQLFGLLVLLEQELQAELQFQFQIQLFLENLSKKELTSLFKYHRNLNLFIHNLYTHNQITLSQTSFSTKRDQIIILTYYYLLLIDSYYQLRGKKLNIQTIIIPSNKEITFQCPICIEEVEDFRRVTTNCNHDICDICTDKYLENLKQKEPCCCLCRSTITTLSFTNVECCNTIRNRIQNKNQ